MSDKPTLAKLTIGSLDDSSINVEAQYNPKELQVDRTVPWAKPQASNKAGSGGSPGEIRLEFTGAEGRNMQVELLFDGYETNGAGVTDNITKLSTLATVRGSDASASDERRPHHCVVSWGDRGLPKFKCVIESLSVKYQMFSPEGKPLRATATVKLKEADSLSVKKAAGAK